MEKHLNYCEKCKKVALCRCGLDKKINTPENPWFANGPQGPNGPKDPNGKKAFENPEKLYQNFKPMVNPPDSGPAPVVAIIGGGLSGLMTAYRLMQNGYKSVVFEANPSRVGGRCWSKYFPTADGLYQYGQSFEVGGELIDNSHLTMKHLAQEFRLNLDNTIAAEKNGTERRMYVAEKTYDPNTNQVTTNLVRMPEQEGIDGYKTLWNGDLKSDYNAASYPWTAYPPPGITTSRANQLDALNMSGEYLDTISGVTQNMPNIDRFNQMLKLVYNVEWSGEPWDMNSLDLHSLLPTRGPGKFRFWGESNEKFRVRNGNSQLADIMEQRINSAYGFSTPYEGTEFLGVKRGYKILNIVRNAQGKYDLTIQVYGSNTSTVRTYDRIVSAIPATIYRNTDRVGPGKEFNWYTNISQSGISSLKMRAIQEIGFGPIGKINISFNSRFWETMGWNGEIDSTTRYARYLKNGVYTGDAEAKLAEETQLQQVWDVTRGQLGTQGILTNYYIGDLATYNKDGLNSNGRVINGQLDIANSTSYEVSKWTSLQSNKDNITRVLTKMAECDAQIGTLAQANLSKNSNGDIISAYESHNWWHDEFTRGAFMYYKPNQLTLVNNGFAGIEGYAEPIYTDSTETVERPIVERNFHFAGSDVDYDFGGWMEGAVRSGERVAMEITSVFRVQGYTPNM